MNRSSIALCLVLFTCTAGAQPDKFIVECFDCHGPNGVSSDKNMPIIAGMSPGYLENTMFDYVDESRPAKPSAYLAGDTTRPKTDMITIAKSLSESQIKQLAAYFSKQKFVAPKQPFDVAKAKPGKQLHIMRCERCHEAAGSIAEDDAGLLAGQWSAYLKLSVEQYRDKSRQGNKKMLDIIGKLTDSEIEALLHYYASANP